MPLCAPSCAVPSCGSLPSVGFGAGGIAGSGLGYGYGLGLGASTSAAALGVLPEAHLSCIGQIPPSEITIQPPSVNVTIPGAILSASCEPVAVGGYAPCSPGGFGVGGFSSGLLGGGFGRNLGYLGNLGRRGSTCRPCN